MTVPAGALSDRRKAGLIDEMPRLVSGEDRDHDTMRVSVHIHEIPDGSRGAAGQPIMFAQLREAAKSAKATDRR